jgi:hypothetical protein
LGGAGLIALVLLLTVVSGAGPVASAAAPVGTRAVILSPFPFLCDLDAEDAEPRVYCWESGPGGALKRHVRLDADGAVSETATAPIPQGIGGPGVPYGAWYTVGPFRCELLRQGIECVVVATGKGFLITRNRIAEVQTPAGIAEPAPVFGKSATVQPLSGGILIREPGEKFTRPLTTGARLPFGTLVDARRGTVQLATAAGPQSGTQTGRFHGGQFRLTQRTGGTRAPDGSTVVGLTVLKLAGPLPVCGAKASALAARTRPAGPRRLWGDAHGNFQTGGKYASATVGGTKWLTEDSCKGTSVKVVRGVVDVEDLKTHRTTSVTAGHSLLVGSGLEPKAESPRGGGTCRQGQTSVEPHGTESDLGTRVFFFRVRNDGKASCRMSGFPRVVAHTVGGDRVPSRRAADKKMESVEIPPGGRAEFTISFGDYEALPPGRCHPTTITGLTVFLPRQAQDHRLRFHERICTRGPLHEVSVGPIE